MIKLRVEGLPAEVEEFIAGIEPYCDVLSQSQMYTNRGESRYVRVYLDVFSCTKKEFLKRQKACNGMADCIADSAMDSCKVCALYDEEAQAKSLDEDEERDCCKHRRERGTVACREGIIEYFAKNPTSDFGAEKK